VIAPAVIVKIDAIKTKTISRRDESASANGLRARSDLARISSEAASTILAGNSIACLFVSWPSVTRLIRTSLIVY
jgi:uncharacterized membrane protein